MFHFRKEKRTLIHKAAAPAIALLGLLLSGCHAPLKEPAVPEATETQPPVTETVAVETAPPETEPPAAEPEAESFVRIADYISTARVELPYATENNFTGKVVYEFTDAYLRYGTLKKLQKAAELLAMEGYGILVWDAYRPVYAQQRLWDIYPDPNYVSQPGKGNQPHCRGLAVDVTLYDLVSGEPLEMPSAFDDFSGLADRDYSDCTEEAAKNATLLESTMKDCGFRPYSAEWWHFSDTDPYEIEYTFDPAAIN